MHREPLSLIAGILGPQAAPTDLRHGDFGPGTEAALRAFQHSRMLLADGVAGPRTLTKLGLMRDASLHSVIPQVTVEKTSVMFPFTPRKNITKYLPIVLQGQVDEELQDKPMVLMALATIRAETEGFVPISEGKSQWNTSPGGKPFDLYDRRTDIGKVREVVVTPREIPGGNFVVMVDVPAGTPTALVDAARIRIVRE